MLSIAVTDKIKRFMREYKEGGFAVCCGNWLCCGKAGLCVSSAVVCLFVCALALLMAYRAPRSFVCLPLFHRKQKERHDDVLWVRSLRNNGHYFTMAKKPGVLPANHLLVPV